MLLVNVAVMVELAILRNCHSVGFGGGYVSVLCPWWLGVLFVAVVVALLMVAAVFVVFMA